MVGMFGHDLGSASGLLADYCTVTTWTTRSHALATRFSGPKGLAGPSL
jgi:hypothetical protein